MTNSLHISQILPLKAFFLGQVENYQADLAKVVDLVEAAIERCGESETLETRKIFYLLLRCELTRGTESTVKNRETAKSFCEEINEEVFFSNYMKLVTYATKAIDIRTPSKTPFYRDPYTTLAVDTRELSEKDRKFLEKVTLVEMLDKHFGGSQQNLSQHLGDSGRLPLS